MDAIETTGPALAAEGNMIAAVQAWAAGADDGAIETADGLALIRGGVGVRTFNQAIIFGPQPNLMGTAGRIRRFFAPAGDHYRVRVRSDVAPLDDAPFEAAGFERRGGIPCLALPLPASPARAARLEVRPVTDVRSLYEHLALIAEVYEWENADLARVLTARTIAQRALRMYTGYLDVAPVAAAQLFAQDGVAGLYLVGTTASARNRGHGEAITRYALEEAAKLRCTMASLQASPMGLPVYKRIGFEEIAYYRTYVPAV